MKIRKTKGVVFLFLIVLAIISTISFAITNTIFNDIDGDGNIDIYLEYVIANNGTAFINKTYASNIPVFPDIVRGYFVDFNNDGDEDLYIVLNNSQNQLYLRNTTGSYSFSNYTNSALGQRIRGDANSPIAAFFADIDGDTDIDAFVNGELWLTTVSFADYNVTNRSNIDEIPDLISVNMKDINLNGLLDIVGVTEDNKIVVYLNMNDSNGDGVPEFYPAETDMGLHYETNVTFVEIGNIETGLFNNQSSTNNFIMDEFEDFYLVKKNNSANIVYSQSWPELPILHIYNSSAEFYIPKIANMNAEGINDTGSGSMAIIGDFDNNGMNDILIANHDNTSKIMLRNGTSWEQHFLDSGANFTNTIDMKYVATYYLDSDGNLDFAVIDATQMYLSDVVNGSKLCEATGGFTSSLSDVDVLNYPLVEDDFGANSLIVFSEINNDVRVAQQGEKRRVLPAEMGECLYDSGTISTVDQNIVIEPPYIPPQPPTQQGTPGGGSRNPLSCRIVVPCGNNPASFVKENDESDFGNNQLFMQITKPISFSGKNAEFMQNPPQMCLSDDAWTIFTMENFNKFGVYNGRTVYQTIGNNPTLIRGGLGEGTFAYLDEKVIECITFDDEIIEVPEVPDEKDPEGPDEPEELFFMDETGKWECPCIPDCNYLAKMNFTEWREEHKPCGCNENKDGESGEGSHQTGEATNGESAGTGKGGDAECKLKSACEKRCIITPCQDVYTTLDLLIAYIEPSAYSSLRWSPIPITVDEEVPSKPLTALPYCGNGKLEGTEECEIGTCIQRGYKCENCKIIRIYGGEESESTAYVRIYEVYTYQEEEITENVSINAQTGQEDDDDFDFDDYEYDDPDTEDDDFDPLNEDDDPDTEDDDPAPDNEDDDPDYEDDGNNNFDSGYEEHTTIIENSNFVANLRQTRTTTNSVTGSVVAQEDDDPDITGEFTFEEGIPITELTITERIEQAYKESIGREHEPGELHSIDLFAIDYAQEDSADGLNLSGKEYTELEEGTIFTYIHYIQDLRAQQEAVNNLMEEANALTSRIFEIINEYLFAMKTDDDIVSMNDAKLKIFEKINEVKDIYYFGANFFKDIDILIDYNQNIDLIQEIQEGIEILSEYISDNSPLSKTQMDKAQAKYNELTQALEQLKDSLPDREVFSYAIDVDIEDDDDDDGGEGCVVDDDCDEGEFCEDGECKEIEKECTSYEDCEENERCIDGKCEEIEYEEYDEDDYDPSSREKSPQQLAEEDFQKGVSAYRSGSYDKALQNFADSLRNDPQKAEAMWMTTKTLEKKGNYGLAVKTIAPITQIEDWDKKIEPYVTEELKEAEIEIQKKATETGKIKIEDLEEEQDLTEEEQAYKHLLEKVQKETKTEEIILDNNVHVLFDICVKQNQEFLFDGEKYKFSYIYQQDGTEYKVRAYRLNDSERREFGIKEFRDKLFETGLCEDTYLKKEKEKPKTYGREPREKARADEKKEAKECKPHIIRADDGREYLCCYEGQTSQGDYTTTSGYTEDDDPDNVDGYTDSSNDDYTTTTSVSDQTTSYERTESITEIQKEKSVLAKKIKSEVPEINIISKQKLVSRIKKEIKENKEEDKKIKSSPTGALSFFKDAITGAAALVKVVQEENNLHISQTRSSNSQTALSTDLPLTRVGSSNAQTVSSIIREINGQKCKLAEYFPEDLLDEIRFAQLPEGAVELTRIEQAPLKKINWFAKRKIELFETTQVINIPIYRSSTDQSDPVFGPGSSGVNLARTYTTSGGGVYSGTVTGAYVVDPNEVRAAFSGDDVEDDDEDNLYRTEEDARVINVAKLFVGSEIRKITESETILDEIEWEKLRLPEEGSDGPLCNFTADNNVVTEVNCQDQEDCRINDDGKIVCREIFELNCTLNLTTKQCLAEFDESGCYFTPTDMPMCPGYDQGECVIEGNEVICEKVQMPGCTFTDEGVECDGFDSCSINSTNSELECKNDVSRLPRGCVENNDGTANCPGFLDGACFWEDADDPESRMVCRESAQIPEGCVRTGNTFECEDYIIPPQCKFVNGDWDCGNGLTCGFGEETIECWQEPGDINPRVPDDCVVETNIRGRGIDMICGEGIGGLSRIPSGCTFFNQELKCLEPVIIPPDCELKQTGLSCPQRSGYCGFDENREVKCVPAERTNYEGFNYQRGQISKNNTSPENCGFRNGVPYCREEGSSTGLPAGCEIRETGIFCNEVRLRIPENLIIKDGKVQDEEGNECHYVNRAWRCNYE